MILIILAVLALSATGALAQSIMPDSSEFGSVSAVEQIQSDLPIGLSTMSLGGNGGMLTLTIRDSAVSKSYHFTNQSLCFVSNVDIGDVWNGKVPFNSTYRGVYQLGNNIIDVFAFKEINGEGEMLYISSPAQPLNCEDITLSGEQFEIQ